MTDSETIKYLESRFQKPTFLELQEYVQAVSDSPDGYMFRIMINESDAHVGNIKVDKIDINHKTAEVGIIIGDQAAWGKGIATDSIRLVSDFAFNNLELEKITAGCYVDNIGSCRAFQKSGYEVEGVLREQCRLPDGRRTDVYRFGLLRRDWVPL
jgi:RimJ/RimL family protein N-acetyltransferase